MSVRRWSRLAGRVGALLLVASAVTVLVGPSPAVGSATVEAQETTNGTATAGNATVNGSQLQTANSDGDDGGGGIVGSLLGLVGGVVGAIAGFLDSTIGHALVGIPLGLYLGLKLIALYLEYYE